MVITGDGKVRVYNQRASRPAGSVTFSTRTKSRYEPVATPTANSASRAGCRWSNARAVNQKRAAEVITNPARSMNARSRTTPAASSAAGRHPRACVRPARRTPGSDGREQRGAAEEDEAGEHQQRIDVGRGTRRGVARSQPELVQDGTHPRVLGLHEAIELVAGEVAIDPAIALQRFAPFRRSHHGFGRRVRSERGRPG